MILVRLQEVLLEILLVQITTEQNSSFSHRSMAQAMNNHVDTNDFRVILKVSFVSSK
jgi:hypothetical protein